MGTAPLCGMTWVAGAGTKKNKRAAAQMLRDSRQSAVMEMADSTYNRVTMNRPNSNAGTTDRGRLVTNTRRIRRMTLTLLIPSRGWCSANRKYAFESCACSNAND